MAINPKKYLIKDIINKPAPLDVWIQGTIQQTVGSDIFIISDTFGSVKVVKSDSTGGIIEKNGLKKGSYCCVIGKAIKTHGLPEIQAMKMIDLNLQPHMKSAWETEVKEAELVLQKRFLPDVTQLLK